MENKCVDNFDLINSLLEFRTTDTFYMCQLIIRGKDHKGTGAANRTVQTHFIDKPETLKKKKNEIIEICNLMGARAMINLNPKSYHQCALNTIASMSKRVAEGDLKKIYREWSTNAGSLKPTDKKDVSWIVDIDTKDEEYRTEITDFLAELWSEQSNKENFRTSPEEIKDNITCFIKTMIPTRNGFHLITRPFDLKKFHDKYPDVDVHKNNPTILYIPETFNTIL